MAAAFWPALGSGRVGKSHPQGTGRPNKLPSLPMQEAPVLVKVAATNRCLAQSNKSRTRAETTKGHGSDHAGLAAQDLWKR